MVMCIVAMGGRLALAIRAEGRDCSIMCPLASARLHSMFLPRP